MPLIQCDHNQAEYEILLTGLKLTKCLKVEHLKVFTDRASDGQIWSSRTDNGQVFGQGADLDHNTQALLYLSHPSTKNARADTLARLAMTTDSSLGQVYIEYLEAQSIEETEKVHQVNHKPSWMDHFVKYLINIIIPDNPPKSKWFKWKASQFVLLDGQLHRKSFFSPTTQVHVAQWS